MDESKIYYFDTSAINQLYRDNEKASIIDVIHKSGAIACVSVINITEAFATKDKKTRNGLLALLKSLSQNRRPLNFPCYLLKASIKAYVSKESDMEWAVSETSGFWTLLNNPKMAGQKEMDELTTYNKEQEKWYHCMHDCARPHMQNTIMNRVDSIKNPLDLIKHCYNDNAFLNDFFGELFKDQGYEKELKNKAQLLLKELEPWKFYFGAMAHGVYNRAVRQKNYSRKKNAGSLDTQQSIYLAACDFFVTNDGDQYEVLGEINKLGNLRRDVIMYDNFKNKLVKNNA